MCAMLTVRPRCTAAAAAAGHVIRKMRLHKIPLYCTVMSPTKNIRQMLVSTVCLTLTV